VWSLKESSTPSHCAPSPASSLKSPAFRKSTGRIACCFRFRARCYQCSFLRGEAATSARGGIAARREPTACGAPARGRAGLARALIALHWSLASAVEIDSQNHLEMLLTLSKSGECNFETVRLMAAHIPILLVRGGENSRRDASATFGKGGGNSNGQRNSRSLVGWAAPLSALLRRAFWMTA